MPQESSEPRELTPVQNFWSGGGNGFKDLSVHLVPVDAEETDEEVAEAEEAMTPAPKVSPVPESATSGESPPPTAPPASVTPALPANVSPTEALEAAVKESGKANELNEDEPQTSSPQSPSPDSSSPSSSSPTSPGKNAPPAPASPPPMPGSTQKQ